MNITDLRDLIHSQVHKYISHQNCTKWNIANRGVVVPILSDYGKEVYPNYKLLAIPDANYEPDDQCYSLIVNPQWFYMNVRLINAWLAAPESTITKHTILKAFGIHIDINTIDSFIDDKNKFNIQPLMDVIEIFKKDIFQHTRDRQYQKINLNDPYNEPKITITSTRTQANAGRNNQINLYGSTITITKIWEVDYSIDQLYLTSDERQELEEAVNTHGPSSQLDNHIDNLIKEIINNYGFDYFQSYASDLDLTNEELMEEEISNIIIDTDDDIYEQLGINTDDDY